MPKANNDLLAQVKEIKATAEKLLKLKTALGATQMTDQLTLEVASLERDLKSSDKSIKIYQYDIKKLDKSHPSYADKLASLQNSLASIMVSRDDYARRLDSKKKALKDEQNRVNKKIAQIESGEYLLSSMDRATLEKELLNKMTYGIGA